MRKYTIIIGSKAFFDKTVSKCSCIEDYQSFLELVKLNDHCTKNGINFDHKTENLIVRNDDYCGLASSALDRISAIIEDFTLNDSEIIIHNPPRILGDHLNGLLRSNKIELEYIKEDYDILHNKDTFKDDMDKIKLSIIGQDNAIDEVSMSLLYLTNVKRNKPYVIMLYGDSGLGKTELVHQISKHFFDNKVLEKHLSMFKANNYSDYLFGGEPNRKSIGFDLLERESNLLFLDELDKCPEHFYSTFYTLFDNTLFKDLNYDVDISGLLIITTSNFKNLDEMKKHLGDPVFYRIDKFVHFNDLTVDVIDKITRKEIEKQLDESGLQLKSEDIFKIAIRKIKQSGENARTIQNNVQKAIEEILFENY